MANRDIQQSCGLFLESSNYDLHHSHIITGGDALYPNTLFENSATNFKNLDFPHSKTHYLVPNQAVNTFRHIT